MSFQKKEKRNPSSRYARIEEPWLDEEDLPEGGEPYGDVAADGYGVRDSYSRQASYGRPDGYYERQRYQEDDWYEEDGRFPDQEGSYDTGSDPYRARNQAEYDARSFYGDEGISPNGRQAYYGPDSGSGRYDGERAGSGRGPDRKVKKQPQEPGRKSKAGFIVKLVLLLIAAVVLVAVWRFSRMRHVSLSDVFSNEGAVTPSGYREFVIYGVDSREGNLTSEAHSDTIILCSMNQSTKEIRMVSVYRDTYLDNTNGEYRKATECYYFGGPSRSVNMLNKNLDLNLHDYVTVDFNAVVKAVDLIGGVDVDVTEEELPYINGYQTENAQVTGAEITPVESAGYQHLNGIQALAYCRIRYTAGSDYRRTERQRAVLSQIFQQAKSQGPVRMAQIVDAMLPYIATSFSSTELLSLASAVTGSTLLDSVGFPFELQAANISAGDCVVPVNLAQNVSELHAYLYQQSGYTPTQTVQDISNEIAYTTGIY